MHVPPAGAVGINRAQYETDSDERYIRAYCSDEDNSEHEWLYWMIGSLTAGIPFCVFGTITVIVLTAYHGCDLEIW